MSKICSVVGQAGDSGPLQFKLKRHLLAEFLPMSLGGAQSPCHEDL